MKSVNDLIVITSFYNPINYKTKRDNFYRFVSELDRANIKWKCMHAIGPDEVPLDFDKRIVRFYTNQTLWQKERLLNIGIDDVSERKVVWCDCDLLFENQDWASDTSLLLNIYPVVQPFENVIRLPKDGNVTGGEKWRGFARNFFEKPHLALTGHFANHGHTGFVWAAQKKALLWGLFDKCVVGSGDHMMAHAFIGDFDGPCIERILGARSPLARSFEKWAEITYECIASKISYAPGTIYHLWHGETTDRRYVLRNQELIEMGFDPLRHLYTQTNGLWAWTEPERFEPWSKKYFKSRSEDGVPA